MIAIVTGLPGASKSYMTAQKIVELVSRNRKWAKKSGIFRPVRSNLVLNDNFGAKANAPITFKDEFNEDITRQFDFFQTWEDPEELPGMNDCDVIWEEMGAHVDSRSWEALPLSLRRWLQQHRHRGVEIYGNCQDFADIDVAVRRLTGSLMYITKLIGSRDPSPTSPPIRFIWGIIWKTYLDPRTYTEDKKLSSGTFAGVEFLSKSVVDLYSMRNDIKPGKYPPLQHRERQCTDCGYTKTIHI